ncbi:urease accessory protein UreD [Pontivivens insulae]|uniref:Urease accessory protein UreD n=1 Tax=Pontivivens insulae TaxID=1639689 RepID=A0A2R8ABI4_9RHOB|nr:urease accessory protein UreD [Pontivivens insulae]RED13328.1 urease accessory protein [Pontivivens insulae]SPF29420.1 Urease accessory protein UreD [Pontivivens insulae]
MTAPFTPPPTSGRPMQRARGGARAAVSGRRLTGLRQSGSGKVLMPATHGGPSQAVFINTAGGVTGGDRFDWTLEAADGAHLVGTTQAAERLYRASGDTGRIQTTLSVGAGARLDWLPLETILFDGSATARRIDVSLEGDADFMALETIVLGRAAMGEHLNTLSFTDDWRIRRDGKLVQAEALRLTGDLASLRNGPATLEGIGAFATFLHSGPLAMDRLDAAREALPSTVTAAASAWNGQLVCRLHAADLHPLRQGIRAFLERYRGDPLPRVWYM